MLKEDLSGLSSSKAMELQKKFGKNELTPHKKQSPIKKIINIVCEPMFLLLIVAAIVYFFLGEPQDGAVMFIFVLLVISISIIQEFKTDRTLNALKNLSAPHITVIRDSKETVIASEDLVPGDLMMIYEGVKIPADGKIIKCNDLCIDESSLTGESQGVWKTNKSSNDEELGYWRKDYCYAGTLVTQGNATVLVDKIGVSTEYGKIGKSIADAEELPTPLQKQTSSLVKVSAIIAVGLCILVAIFTYFNAEGYSFIDKLTDSILSGITLAMAMIPEEFPVVLAVFLSMGAWRLAKKHSLVRKLPSVETLGAVSVLCVDKTGTITTNQMEVVDTWSIDKNEYDLCKFMGFACEVDAYDPMEKAMIFYCEKLGVSKKELFSGKLIKEYPFTNELKMMGHVWEKDNEIILASKGSPEKILTICSLDDISKEKIKDKALEMSHQGFRVIAVASKKYDAASSVPDDLTDCLLDFCGLIGLEDPPRESVKNDISTCNKAGIRVVMITGDNGSTASAIAKKVNIPHGSHIITGDMIDNMSDEELRNKVKDVSIFSRVVPEHKMRIVKAFRDNGEIVAMTGDGVNDAPALKYAHIGISMGKRGSEVSREASDLILMDDNFTTIVETVKDGRRIYDNIRKAIGYIFAVHIPIALSALFAPVMGIANENWLLLPLHVALLQIIIDPTCSIVLERQPAELDIMQRKPRNPKEKILNAAILWKSIIQGLVIFVASFGMYLFTLNGNYNNASKARSMGLVIIILSNLLLVLVNSSNHEFMYKSIGALAKDKVIWAIDIAAIIGLVIILYTPLNTFLGLEPLCFQDLILVVLISTIAVLWYEIVKLFKMKRKK